MMAATTKLNNNIMKFYVNFTTKTNGYVVDIQNFEGSLLMLDEIRAMTDVPNLHPDKIYSCESKFKRREVVELTEEHARKSGQFYSKNKVNVQVPENFLNNFYEICYNVQKDPETGEIKSVIPYYSLNNETLVESWIEAGSPLSWDEE